MIENIILIISAVGGFAFFAAVFAFAWFRGTALLQFFQQEEYDTDRFLKWIVERSAFDKRASLTVLIAFLIYYFLKWIHPGVFGVLYYALGLMGLLVGIKASRKTTAEAKKPLVKTERAQRLHTVYVMLAGIYFGIVLALFEPGDFQALTWSFLFFFQFPPLFLGAANFILKPYEERVNERFLKDALNRLKGLHPKIIAVTGSYGKTSIKHILSHILAAKGPTLATPGSVNTPMGIVRVIRENLESRHKYFVVEMGAYGPGSIKRLCKITPPDLGIISAVGFAHFERFKSLKTVFHTKFELADKLKKKNRPVIVNADAIDQKMLSEYQAKNSNVIVCGSNGNHSLVSYAQTKNGLEVTLKLAVEGSKKDLNLNVPLYGPHQATNILLAAAAAVELGVSLDTIKAALKTMPQVSHRLEVTRQKGGVTVIDDAYNSNPAGFSNALDLLETLKEPGGRTILLTPGMVELGKEHNTQHKTLAEKAAKLVDLALVVGPDRMAAFIDAFQATPKKKGTLYTFKTQSQAEKWYFENALPNDVILIENNLPDLYEADIMF